MSSTEVFDTTGVEPQPCTVTVYHAQPLTGAAKGEKDDLFLAPKKVTIVGLEADDGGGVASKADSEFAFDETHGPSVAPATVAQRVVPRLVHGAVGGINGLLLVLGETGSGKTEMVHGLASGSAAAAGAWEGVAERCLNELFDALPSDSLMGADDRYAVRMQFLNIAEERVQDLMQPNCHAHDLALVERPESGVLVSGADEVELKGKDQGIRLYRAARDELSRLERYHGVNAAAQCCLLTLTVVRRAVAREVGSTAEGAMGCSLTIVELPGSERLAEDRSQLHVREEPFLHRSITHFSELVSSLARRGQPEHVPWKGGKLTTLLRGRLGANALTHAIATVRGGHGKQSAATLRCASQLRDVVCYPLINSAAAKGLLSIHRSEVLALRADMAAMEERGIDALPGLPPAAAEQPPQLGDRRRTFDAADLLNSPVRKEAPADASAAPAPAEDGTPAAAEAARAEGARGAPSASELTPLEESTLQGKLIQSELVQEQLKAQRIAVIKEKAELQTQYDALLREKQEVDRQLLDADHERLKVAKALVDLQVEGTAQSSLAETQLIDLEGAVQRVEGEKKAIASESAELAAQVAGLEDDLRVSQAEKEDLVNELLAARSSLEAQRQQGQVLVSDARERDLEIVRSVKQAEHRAAQIGAQADALTSARAETDKVRSQLHGAERRTVELEAEVADLKREASVARSQREELQMAARRAAVQRELFEVSVSKERAELNLQRQQLHDSLAEGQRQARAEALRLAEAERGKSARRDTELVQARAEVGALKHKCREVEERSDQLERSIDEGERRLQAAHESFRQSLREALAVHFEQTVEQVVPQPADRARAEGDEGQGAAGALLEALVRAYDENETHLRQRLDKLQRRHWAHLDQSRREAAQATQAAARRAARGDASESGEGEGMGEGGPPGGVPASSDADSTDATATDAAEQIDAADAEEAVMQALQAEGRAVLQAYVEEAAQLRAERGALRGELQASVLSSQSMEQKMTEERSRMQREMAEVRAEAAAAARTLHETGGENASVKLKAEAEKAREVQGEMQERIDALNALRERTVELKEREIEETGSTVEEVRALRAEREALRSELNIRLREDPKTLQILRLQLRDYSTACAQLEQERSRYMRRATTAEQQLETLQGALSDNLLRYQKEILRLRKQQPPAAPALPPSGGGGRPGSGRPQLSPPASGGSGRAAPAAALPPIGSLAGASPAAAEGAPAQGAAPSGAAGGEKQ